MAVAVAVGSRVCVRWSWWWLAMACQVKSSHGTVVAARLQWLYETETCSGVFVVAPRIFMERLDVLRAVPGGMRCVVSRATPCG